MRIKTSKELCADVADRWKEQYIGEIGQELPDVFNTPN